MCSRISLGTAQFGMKYGVTNQTGQINRGEAGEILLSARAAGMDTLDTAIAYGYSEEILGSLGVKDWKVVSKLPMLPKSCTNLTSWVMSELAGSILRLGVSKLHGLLLHNSQQLLEPHGKELYRSMRDAQQNGLVDKIGVSIYQPSELDMLLPKFSFDLVQSPLSVFDRRLVSSGWLQRLHHSGTEVHVRSVFLQGLLLQSPEKRQSPFFKWNDLWSKWDSWLANKDLSAIRASLMFPLSFPEIDRVVVGVDSANHLDEILSVPKTGVIDFPQYLESSDLRLINPTLWNL